GVGVGLHAATIALDQIARAEIRTRRWGARTRVVFLLAQEALLEVAYAGQVCLEPLPIRGADATLQRDELGSELIEHAGPPGPEARQRRLVTGTGREPAEDAVERGRRIGLGRDHLPRPRVR